MFLYQSIFLLPAQCKPTRGQHFPKVNMLAGVCLTLGFLSAFLQVCFFPYYLSYLSLSGLLRNVGSVDYQYVVVIKNRGGLRQTSHLSSVDVIMHVLRVPDEFEQANHSRIKALSVNLTGERERLRSLLDERNFEDIKKHLEDTPPESFDVSTPLLVILIYYTSFSLRSCIRLPRTTTNC